jgi:glycosyltransferase involved in cell wall biosynthesis
MRILMLSQWFDPEPAIKGLPFARALVAAGHEVRVITGFPNYPGGKVYPGYRIRPYRHETIDGIRITRVALYPSHDGSAVRRVLNYGSFALTATIAGLVTEFEPDVMYVYHPPLTVGLAAAVIGGIRRIPFIYDVQDLWPDTLAATGMIGSPRLLSIVGGLAEWVYRRADIVVAQSPGFVTRLIDRGVPPEKVRLIHNWCDEASLATRSAAAVDLAPLAGRFNVVFAGNMGKAQALDAVLDAAAIVARRDARVQFVLLGGGTEAANLESRARTMSLTNVAFLPRLEMNQVGHVLDAADALLVHLRDSPLFSITLPSKTQAYLFAAKPIIMAVPGDAANLVARAGAGVCAQPEDPQSIANAVLHLAELPSVERVEMGARGRRFYDDALSLRTGTAHMLEAFEHAIAGGPRRSHRVHP